MDTIVDENEAITFIRHLRQIERCQPVNIKYSRPSDIDEKSLSIRIKLSIHEHVAGWSIKHYFRFSTFINSIGNTFVWHYLQNCFFVKKHEILLNQNPESIITRSRRHIKGKESMPTHRASVRTNPRYPALQSFQLIRKR